MPSAAAAALLGDYTDALWFPEPASTFADNIDTTYDLIFWISFVFFVGIVYCLVYFSIKYWKKPGERAESQKSHNTPLELAWSILPSFLLVWMFVQGAMSFLDMRTAPDGAYEVNVQAFKWGWTMDYGGGTFHPELHILVDEPTKLSMRSSDVIHSLFIPAFRVKKDVVPGRYNHMWFQATVASEKVSDEELAQATRENEGGQWDYDKHQFTPDGYTFFDLYCAEYCGKDHSQMQTVVVVHETREDLDAWIKENSTRGDVPPAEWGERLYSQRGCQGCHSIDGSQRVGPSFQDLFGSEHALASGEQVSVGENYVRESILDPKAKVAAGFQPVMPSYQGQLTDDDIASIIAFMQTISEEAPAAGGEQSVEGGEQSVEGGEQSVEGGDAAGEGEAPGGQATDQGETASGETPAS